MSSIPAQNLGDVSTFLMDCRPWPGVIRYSNVAHAEIESVYLNCFSAVSSSSNWQERRPRGNSGQPVSEQQTHLVLIIRRWKTSTAGADEVAAAASGEIQRQAMTKMTAVDDIIQL